MSERPTAPRLCCLSFHSVKGGVGKSTLAAAAAGELLRGGMPSVALVDFDLTGTSVADVLALEAPVWSLGPDGTLDLTQPPGTRTFHTLDESRKLVSDRAFEGVKALEATSGAVPGLPSHVPFLNDYLLYTHPSWSPENDLKASSLAWRWGGVDVHPSSALPADVARILPLVYDEENAGFLESRVEWFLEQLVPEPGKTAAVVFDTPPTVPGLSRSILSIALRLSKTPKLPLAVDGVVPTKLSTCNITWRAFLVASRDEQDLIAAGRWLDMADDADFGVLRMLANRMGSSDFFSLASMLRDRGIEERFAKDALVVRDDPRMNLKSWQKPADFETALGEAFKLGGELTRFFP